MPTMAHFTQEKQRISEQIARIDAERSKLQGRLSELEVAERVLSRFGRRAGRAASRSKQDRTSGESPRATARRQRTARPKAQSLPLAEATLRAVKAHSRGVSADAVRDYLAKRFGLTVRPNHLGMALQRHRRAGRLEIRDTRWYAL
jgi:hypothetical protein